MQKRSFRGSGEPVWVNALSSACERLGPDPRRALGPAATPAASTGRTRDRTRPMLQNVRKFLPGRRPHVTHSGPRIAIGTGACSFSRSSDVGVQTLTSLPVPCRSARADPWRWSHRRHRPAPSTCPRMRWSFAEKELELHPALHYALVGALAAPIPLSTPVGRAFRGHGRPLASSPDYLPDTG
jgi:hypothetical protein